MALNKDAVKSRYSNARAKAKEFMGEGMPYGTHEAELVQFQFVENEDQATVIEKWTGRGGEADGYSQTRWNNVDHEVGLSILMQTFAFFDFDIDSINSDEELIEMCAELLALKPVVTIQVSENKKAPKYPNLKLVEILSTSEDEEEEEEKKPSKESKSDEPDTEAEDEDEVDIEVGDSVVFMHKGEKLTKTVIDMNDEDKTLTVKIGRTKVELSEEDIIDVIPAE